MGRKKVNDVQIVGRAMIEFMSDGTWKLSPLPLIISENVERNEKNIELTNLSSSVGQILLAIKLFLTDVDNYFQMPDGLSKEEEEDFEFERESIGYEIETGFSNVINNVASVYRVTSTSVRNKFSKYLINIEKSTKEQKRYLGVNEFRDLVSGYVSEYYNHYDTNISDLEETLYDSLLKQRAREDRIAIDKFFRNPREITLSYQNERIV